MILSRNWIFVGFFLVYFIYLPILSCFLMGISGLIIFLTILFGKKSELKFKLKIERKENNTYRIILWIQKRTKLEKELESLFNFFEENIHIIDSGIVFKFYKITSENPAIMLSLCSAINELIPDTYFNTDLVF